ncbi:helix-turn-helix domain-containing protein [Prosthecomicrobium sp. N25]|uniref:helix-turn-helix domain-containing protein n=1 Tax=Prosthecomicrobium sp. N25 TaxID=3129254 RepID=UPI0030769A46
MTKHELRDSRESLPSTPARQVFEFSPKALFLKNYEQAQYHFVQFVSEHLADCSREFDGDLQEMLVLAIVGQVTLNWRLANAPEPVAPPSITASRLADVTGIPRQTVRRKLLSLQRRGWVEQHERAWRLAMKDGITPASKDLAALNGRGIDRASRLLSAFHRLRLDDRSA